MRLYDIKQDGYPIGQRRGKNNAVKSIKSYMEWEGVTKSEWKNKNGIVTVETDKGIFTIEENS